MATTSLNDGAFFDPTSVNSGTGNYDSFLRLQASPTEEGYNTSAGAPLDDKGGPWTHSILLSALQIVNVGGVDYYEIRIDLNETNGKTGAAIDLTQFDLYVGGAATATDFTPAGVTSDVNLTKVYSLTSGLPLTDVSNGSGTDDGAIYVPVSAFSGAGPNAYMTLFASFSGSDGGFEEFRALTNTSTPVNGQGDIVMAKIPDVTQVDQAGQVIHYTIDVNNDGTAGLHNLVVTDPLASDIAATLDAGGHNVGDTNHDGVLDPGETWVYTASHTVTQADIDNNGNPDNGSGVIFNEALATDTEGVNSFADSTVDIVQNPALKILKVASVKDGTADHAGDEIDYVVTVQNTGNMTLTGLNLNDTVPGVSLALVSGDTNSNGKLDVGETWTFGGSHIVTQADLDGKGNNGGDGSFYNTASVVTDQGAGGQSATSTPLTYDPEIAATKTVDHISNGTASAHSAGDVVFYDFTVGNTGNITLNAPALSDSLVTDMTQVLVSGFNAGDTNQNGLLDVGETWQYTGSHTVSQDELNAAGNATPHDGLLHNTVQVTDNATVLGDPVSTSASASAPLDYAPAITATKVVDHISNGNASAHNAGDIVYYDFTVTNAGNITLNAPTLNDNLVSGVTPILALGTSYNLGDTNLNGLLDVGETWQYIGAHTVTQGELDAKGNASPADGLLHNTVQVSDNTTVLGDAVSTSASATAPLDYDPHIKLQKTVVDVLNPDHSLDTSGKINAVGDIVDYSFAVTSTGNVSLNGTTPTDPLIANIVAKTSGGFNVGDANHDGLINPGETWLFTGSMSVTQAQINAAGNNGLIVNTATVNDTGVSGGAVSDTSSASVQVVLPGPGVRTPGFWYNNGAPLWDGNGATMTNGGTLNIVAKGGDLNTHAVDVNGNGVFDAAETGNAGQYLLIGDWNHDGKTDNGEHTLLVSRTDALALLNASAKQQGDARWTLARDLVASWLDALAGNGVGPVDANGVPLTSSAAGYDANSPGHYIDDAIQWLAKETPLGAGNLLSLGSGHNSMPGTAIPTSSALWSGTVTGFDKTAADMHSSLDGYNNTGIIHGNLYAPLPSV